MITCLVFRLIEAIVTILPPTRNVGGSNQLNLLRYGICFAFEIQTDKQVGLLKQLSGVKIMIYRKLRDRKFYGAFSWLFRGMSHPREKSHQPNVLDGHRNSDPLPSL
jgi:hypothetical protein